MTDRTWTVPEPDLFERIRDRLEGGGNDGNGEGDGNGDEGERETDTEVEKASENRSGDEATVLATLVDVDGSAYRRPGAKMLFDADGADVGTITAGCLEDELRRAAEAVRETGRSRLVSYDLRETDGDDDSDVWGLGVGCNGRLEILLEPIAESLRPAVTAFDEGRGVAVCTVLDDDGPLERGDRAYRHPAEGDERERIEVVDGDFEDWPIDAFERPVRDLLERGRGKRIERDLDGRRLEVFVDGLAAPPELVICGTGHDVGPVVELASVDGFRVTVVGFRGAVDLEERFPDAHRTVTTSPARLREDLPFEIDDRTHAVVMTHNFVDDRLAVDELLGSPAPYVGLLGPRERFEEMRAAFESEGRQFSATELEALYTPIGLDLGSGSPYGIAHSIVAEVLAVANDRDPIHLSARDGPIHDRVDVEDEHST